MDKISVHFLSKHQSSRKKFDELLSKKAKGILWPGKIIASVFSNDLSIVRWAIFLKMSNNNARVHTFVETNVQIHDCGFKPKTYSA